MKTFGELRGQVEKELDTEEEQFIQETEMQGYFDSGITLIEAEIVKLGLREKYLQGESFISTIQGQSDYALPADIVANKIRKMVYRNGLLVYTLRPYRGEEQYVAEDIAALQTPNEYYHYAFIKAGGVTYIRLIGTPQVAVTNAIRMKHWIKLNRYTDDNTICDLPDICYEFLLSYVRYRIYSKEGPSNANAQNEKADMGTLRALMTDTLQNQVADPDMDLMDRDWSHYEEMN